MKTAPLLLVLCASALVAPITLAQNPTSKPAVAIDPRAHQVLAQSVAAYGKLGSLSLQTQMRTARGPYAQESSARLWWKKPGMLRVETSSKSEEDGSVDQRRFFVSSQKFVQTSVRAGQARYSSEGTDLGDAPEWIEQALGVVDPNGLHLYSLLQGKSPLARLRPLMKQLALQEQTEDEKTALGACDVVAARIESDGPRGSGPTAELKYFFSREDRLLRRFQLKVSSDASPNAEESTADFLEVRANPLLPDATLRPIIPAGAKRVADLDPNYDPRLQVGTRPFDFKAADLQSKAVSPASYKGKVWLLDFWATWCPPCVDAAPAISRAYKAHHAKGFEVLGISLDSKESDLKKFAAKYKMPWRQVFDGKGWATPLVAKYGVQGIPFSLLIGRDGRIIAVDPKPKKLDGLVRRALARS
jgi:peroxiredoxin/outer membrane lipoprotein-sorting protein